jgi:hypothetical protein
MTRHLDHIFSRFPQQYSLTTATTDLQIDVCLSHIHPVAFYLTLHNVRVCSLLQDLPLKGTLDSYSAVEKFPKVHPHPLQTLTAA